MKKSVKGFKKGISPIQILPLGFLAVIAAGTALLMLPSAAHGRTTLFEALFTAVSSSCVTGLVVLDTGTHFTVFGQIVILCLIQLGGLGFMTMSSLLFSMLGRSVSIKQRLTMAEGLGQDRLQGVVRLALNAIKLTFAVEFAGAALLAIRFIPDFGVAGGIWRAVFHSVSAFCNAGFDLMGDYSSLTRYACDPVVNFTVMALIIVGGLGFAVLEDMGIGRWRGFKGLKLHSKLVLAATAGFLAVGAALFFAFEFSNPNTMGGMNLPDKLMASLFQSVTCRTAGFNTISQSGLSDPGKLLSCILMFIGGAPAGTAGGVKITTVVIIALTVRAFMLGRRDTEAFGRSIPSEAVRRALCILFMALLAAITAVTLISLTGVDASFIDILFEVFSAIGTVGLSAGVTGVAGPVALCVLIALMYIGRVGIMTVALSFSRDDNSVLRYPEDNVMVG